MKRWYIINFIGISSISWVYHQFHRHIISNHHFSRWFSHLFPPCCALDPASEPSSLNSSAGNSARLDSEIFVARTSHHSATQRWRGKPKMASRMSSAGYPGLGTWGTWGTWQSLRIFSETLSIKSLLSLSQSLSLLLFNSVYYIYIYNANTGLITPPRR